MASYADINTTKDRILYISNNYSDFDFPDVDLLSQMKSHLIATSRFVEFDISEIDDVIEFFIHQKKYGLIIHFDQPCNVVLIYFLNNINRFCEIKLNEVQVFEKLYKLITLVYAMMFRIKNKIMNI